MSSTPPLRPPSASSATDRDKKDIVSHGTGANESLLTLNEAMKAADDIRKTFRERNDAREAEQMVPPGTWQGAAAFVATGLLMTPFRRSILKIAGPSGSFQGFVDLVVTPILAVGAAQVALVVGSLYGSSYYLDRLARDAATTTKPSSLGSNEIMSVRFGPDDKVTYAPTTESLAAERESAVAELCQKLLSSLSPASAQAPSQANIYTPSLPSTTNTESGISSFGSWDPRSRTMKSLLHAVDKCRRRED